ncbi:MAG: prepilin peptidase [Acetobacter papayae]
MVRLRTPKPDINDILLSISVTAIIVLWSLLVRNDQASLGGLLVAIWFPLSIITFRFLLRRLPLLGGIRAYPTEKTLAWKRLVTAGCLLVASFSIIFLARLSPPAALGNIIALNFACLAALLDRTERWLPPALLVPMLLAGLLAGILRDTPAQAILGAAIAWGSITLVLVFLSALFRRTALSGGEAIMAAACGAWIELRGVEVFVLASLALHCTTYLLTRRFSTSAAWPPYLDRQISLRGTPMGPSLALGLAITLLAEAILPGTLRVFPQ